MKDQIKFTMFSDLHHNIMHDGKERLEVLLKEASSNDSDFLIQLGDFCRPDEEGEELIDMYNGLKIDSYHVIGNHDLDCCDKTEFLRAYNMDKSYYTFSYGDFLFVVLDTNFINLNNQFIDYSHGNYYKCSKNDTYMSADQILWLENTIRNTDKYVVLFSHAAIYMKGCIVKNSNQVRKVIENENKRCGFNKVICSFNGHNHIDTHTVINDIHYIDVNSASNQWLGDGYECIRYSKEICEKHPNLKRTAPYKDPIYQTVIISSDGKIEIKGIESSFVGKTPLELGHCNMMGDHLITPSIESRSLRFKIIDE